MFGWASSPVAHDRAGRVSRWPHRLAVRTSASHAGNAGSIPAGVATLAERSPSVNDGTAVRSRMAARWLRPLARGGAGSRTATRSKRSHSRCASRERAADYGGRGFRVLPTAGLRGGRRRMESGRGTAPCTCAASRDIAAAMGTSAQPLPRCRARPAHSNAIARRSIGGRLGPEGHCTGTRRPHTLLGALRSGRRERWTWKESSR